MELRFTLTRKRVALAVSAAALVMAGAAIGVTSNAYTDANGAYHGCVGSSSGLMRVLASGETCRSSEVAIDWNQAGVQGVKGEKGETGAKGEKGDTGATGLQGEQGSKGDTGAQGTPGLKGDTGVQGLPGGLGGLQTVSETHVIPKNGGQQRFVATCPAGKVAVSAGISGPAHLISTTGAIPNQGTWEAGVGNSSSIDVTVTMYTLCANG